MLYRFLFLLPILIYSPFSLSNIGYQQALANCQSLVSSPSYGANYSCSLGAPVSSTQGNVDLKYKNGAVYAQFNFGIPVCTPPKVLDTATQDCKAPAPSCPSGSTPNNDGLCTVPPSSGCPSALSAQGFSSPLPGSCIGPDAPKPQNCAPPSFPAVTPNGDWTCLSAESSCLPPSVTNGSYCQQAPTQGNQNTQGATKSASDSAAAQQAANDAAAAASAKQAAASAAAAAASAAQAAAAAASGNSSSTPAQKQAAQQAAQDAAQQSADAAGRATASMGAAQQAAAAAAAAAAASGAAQSSSPPGGYNQEQMAKAAADALGAALDALSKALSGNGSGSGSGSCPQCATEDTLQSLKAGTGKTPTSNTKGSFDNGQADSDLSAAKADYQSEFNNVRDSLSSLVNSASNYSGSLPTYHILTFRGESIDLNFNKYASVFNNIGNGVVFLGYVFAVIILLG